MNRYFHFTLGIASFALLTACSSDSLKRNAYQSVQTMQQQECLKQPNSDCPPAESYNQYQKQREQDLQK
jgi:outer membrane biogenesis lipoprotein LolB